jgi:Ca2+-binding EF-hand superfamily protein
MISVINALEGYQYLRQLLQPKNSSTKADQLFSKVDKNGDGSIGKDELSAYQANMEAQFKGSVMGSQTDSTSSFLALLESSGLAQATDNIAGTAVTTSTADQTGGTPTDRLFSKIDTDGNGLITKDEFSKAASATHHSPHRRQSGHKPGSLNSSASPMDQLFTKIDANGDGSITKDEITTFVSSLGRITNSNKTSGGNLTATV